jgi:hypothetical protein
MTNIKFRHLTAMRFFSTVGNGLRFGFIGLLDSNMGKPDWRPNCRLVLGGFLKPTRIFFLSLFGNWREFKITPKTG